MGTPLYVKIFKNFTISAAGSILTMILGLAQTSLLTKSIGISDYGRIGIIIHFFIFMQLFLDFRIQDVCLKYYPSLKSKGHTQALQGLLFICLVSCTCIGLFLFTSIYCLSPVIAKTLYNDPLIGDFLRIYVLSVFFTSFKGFCTTLLRLHDKFIHIVVAEIIGSLFSTVALFFYIIQFNGTSLQFVILIMTIGAVLKTIYPMLVCIKLLKRLFIFPLKDAVLDLKLFRKEIMSTLYQTNILGYLKIGADSGGLFLLGILSTPTQVAYYNIAKQLSQPLLFLQNNIQVAFSPELALLYAENKFDQILKIVQQYIKMACLFGGFVVVIAFFAIKPVIVLFTTQAYINAIPIFYMFMLTAFLTFISMPFYQLALLMDQLKSRNLIVSIRFIYLIIACLVHFNAFTLSLVQVFGALTTRIFNDYSLFGKLKTKCNDHVEDI